MKWVVQKTCQILESQYLPQQLFYKAQGTTLEMEKLIAKSPASTAHDTKEGAYQDLNQIHGTNRTKDKAVYAVK